jgi:DNA repair exonuclease SbcCD ATPase subunit
LELQIEQERARYAAAERKAEEIRGQHAALLEKVRASEISLSTQLERATREHNLKIERLESEFDATSEELNLQRHRMEEDKERLKEEIAELTDLRELAEEIGRLRQEIESRKKNSQHELAKLDEEFETVAYEKAKRIKEIKREHELELAQLQTQHKKDVLQENRQAAEELLARLNLVAVAKEEWERIQKTGEEAKQRDEEELARIRVEAQNELRKEYNINTSEVTDVTDLFYRHQAASREVDALRAQVDKLENEIKRMREHIEREPSRIAAAVEAAKVHVQNTIEQSGKR